MCCKSKTFTMKPLQRIILLFILIIGVFSFTVPENNLNLNRIDVMELLSIEASRSRPSSEFMFYVETEIIKKSRGSSTILASIFIYERATGRYKSLTNNSIVVPHHREAILDYDVRMKDFRNILENGDMVLESSMNSSFDFNKLIEHKTIYKSYLASRNKLLKVN